MHGRLKEGRTKAYWWGASHAGLYDRLGSLLSVMLSDLETAIHIILSLLIDFPWNSPKSSANCTTKNVLTHNYRTQLEIACYFNIVQMQC